jgi:hypothetical protein
VRFITQYPGYIVQIRPQRQRSLGDGSIEITQEPIYARFRPLRDGAFIFENEEAQAVKTFDFRGNTQELDQATPTDPLQRLALYDTDEEAEREQWDRETREVVERKLIEITRESPNDLILITTHPIEAPFPRYDGWEGSAKDLVARVMEDGFDLEQVLYYEMTFGPKRLEVVGTLEAMIEVEKEQTVNA